MHVVEIADPEEFAALQPRWRALFEACPQASPFQSPEWLLAWRRVFLPNGLWTLSLWDGGRLAALAPFYVHQADDGARQLTLLGNGISDRLDVLAAPQDADAAAAAVFAHLGERDIWDRCDFRDLPEGSPLLAGAPSGAAQDVIEPEPPCPTLDLHGEADLPETRRRDLARCARRLAERGEVAYRTADAASRAADLATLVRLHGACWGVRGGKGVLGDPVVQRFHEAASAALLAAGRLRLDVLSLDGRPVAAHYGLRCGNCGYSYIHGYDPELAACAPGRLLLAHVVESARRDGLAAFDFLRGQEGYKYEWGARDRRQFRRRIVR